MNSYLSEDDIEVSLIETLKNLGYETLSGPAIAPENLGGRMERINANDPTLPTRLRLAIERLNPGLPARVHEAALVELNRAASQNLLMENHRLWNFLVRGVPVEFDSSEGIVSTRVRLADFEDPLANDWVAVSQFTIEAGRYRRRADVVIFLNGLPIALFELKTPSKPYANLRDAWNQLDNYQRQVPDLFNANQLCVISDGLEARVGAVGTPFEHYASWKTIDNEEVVSKDLPELDVVARGLFEPSRFLSYLRYNVIFSQEAKGLTKKVAKYHQYWAVEAAVQSTVAASSPEGDRRGGIIWHTQGSGKSLEMLMFANRLMQDSRMNNPTLVVLTDRNDLDDQLYKEVFLPAKAMLSDVPVRARSRKELRNLLTRQSGGIIFSTIQKFSLGEKSDAHPELTPRRNVVVIADEAHRSQYDVIDGFARHLRDALPGATFIGFTGTPIEEADRSTRGVFGDYVSKYDLTRAVEDGATVKIFYESRLVRIHLDATEKEILDEKAEEVDERAELAGKKDEASKWARQEAIVGSDARIKEVAKDFVSHWEKRRADQLGKCMVVAMSRRVAAALYKEIVALRPDWHDEDPKKGRIKVVYTSASSDSADIAVHAMNDAESQEIKRRAKDAKDSLEIVIVRDMWLTGFDAPVMHTMYVDKPMQGAGLMQAIARVNRVFGGKQAGLIVDYIGIAHKLSAALAEYTAADQEQAGLPTDKLVDAAKAEHDVVKGILSSHTWSSDPKADRFDRQKNLKATLNFILADQDRKTRFTEHSRLLRDAFLLVGARDEVTHIREDVTFFSALLANVSRLERPIGVCGGEADVDTAFGQLVSSAIAADGIVDIFAGLGLGSPELSILSPAFLEKIKSGEKDNLQFEVLRRLLVGQVKLAGARNAVEGRSFSEKLEKAIRSYTNRTIDTAAVIKELIELAEDMQRSAARGEQLGLTEDELAFYDAIRTNREALFELGDEVLKAIARDLVEVVRKNTTLDWDRLESRKAKLRTLVKGRLRHYKYPPDKREDTVDLVLRQAELLAKQATYGP